MKSKGKRPMFSLNGSLPLNKRNLVYAAVETFMRMYPDSTCEDVVSFFPDNLQGGLGVVTSEEEYYAHIVLGQDVYKRYYFVDRPLSASDTRFYVCKEWGNNFSNFRDHISREFGWTIEEV